MTLTRIGTADVHNITSGQVIIDLSTASKELLENSLDAGATQVTITFKNHGIDSIEVSDNGTGIDEEDFDGICMKHYTSKLRTFEDVANVRTLGFRGEALSSLCAVARVDITTSTKSIQPRAYKLEYDHHGRLKSKQTASRNCGTTVLISDIFRNLPVRKTDLVKNGRREFQKAVTLLQSYALIKVGLRLVVQHVDSRGRKGIMLATSGSKQLRSNVLSVFGANGMAGLEPIDFRLNISARFKLKACDMLLSVHGYLSNCSFGKGRSATDRQFWFVNGRPVKLQQFSKAITDVYKTFNHLQCPVILLDLELDPQFIDVNVTPDKRTIFLHNEAAIIEALKERVTEIFSSQDISIPKSQLTMERSRDNRLVKDGAAEVNQRETGCDLDPEEEDGEKEEHEGYEEERSKDESDEGRADVSDIDESGAQKLAEAQSTDTVTPISPGTIHASESEGEAGPADIDDTLESISKSPVSMQVQSTLKTQFDKNAEVNTSTPDSEPGTAEFSKVDDQILSSDTNESNEVSFDRRLGIGRETSSPLRMTVRDKYIETHPTGQRKLSFEPKSEKRTASATLTRTQSSLHDTELPIKASPGSFKMQKPKLEKSAGTRAAVDDITDESDAERKLTLSVSKKDFLEMQVIGQFNLGFILVTKQDKSGTHLFIIDQHASDEKYNFERYQTETVFNNQPLVIPQQLHLNIIDELAIMNNLEVFGKNGFGLRVDEDAQPGERLSLTSLPYSKDTTFGLSDLDELVHLVKEHHGRGVLRPSKVRAMLAMRACRTSIMIGKPLSHKTMTSVVRNLAALDKPWNCPHGRPTMRHLIELKNWATFSKDYET
ncbi:hypothetical protein KL918_001305 [Ogataea parapolymorpha]|uniref:DNA mismatch repair protein PMS1 n=1 Tax=Ogataea parapolymorpha (strain ATCC 26012 / BCRC 20466 / JCM 22074 / NRRL Y-7560 / DL-1) TaxID=871575 RepID=W1QE88_OGAPD|nr:DNA mismatch repair protein PMS1 [Ogataea parapolymorpha DL-1]ESW99759.1 DNA mismatch repair protein PMS1 [Ogataea parapolymorpha DL-1]KAG7868662.1 hypothetical protein KL918_001305 [Ogataea parapolymorpha]KAG7874556.1 hypothetical protein KL916_001322 [Ogataea parapolymorpha]